MAKIIVEFPDWVSPATAVAQITKGFPDVTGFQVIQDWVDEPARVASIDAQTEALAWKVVARIRPTESQGERQKFLRHIWLGLNSLDMSEGEEEGSPRAISSALSRSLRPVFPDEQSPMDAVFRRKRMHDQSGQFIGIKYEPTAVGRRAIQILVEEGSLGDKPDPSQLAG